MSKPKQTKEEVVKEVSSIIASAPKGLSPRDAERDYFTMIGKPLPYREMGYHSAEEFFSSVPETIGMRNEGGHLILYAIPNEKTENIISLIQRNKPSKSRRGSRGRGRGMRFGGQSTRLRPSYSSQYKMPPRLSQDYASRVTRVVRTQTPVVPALARGEIKEILLAHPNGVSVGSQFDSLYKEKHGHSINFNSFGFPTMSAMFKSMSDLLEVTYPSSGGCLVHLRPQFRKNIETKVEGSGSGAKSSNESLKDKIRKVLRKHPDGIYCSKFQQMYKDDIGEVLPYRKFGYSSVIEFMDSMNDIVSKEKSDRDWLLYDASIKRPLPPTKAIQPVSAVVPRKPDAFHDAYSTAPPVPLQFLQNLKKVVAVHSGLVIDELPLYYKKVTGEDIDIREYGYSSLQDLVLMCTSVVELKYLGRGRVVLNALDFNPSQPALAPAIVQSTVPEDAVGEKCCYPSIRLESSKIGVYVEVNVSQVNDPGVFWIQLRGRNTTEALENVMDRLDDAYNRPSGDDYCMPDRMVKVGQVCAAFFCEDGNWHRAVISEITDNDFVLCYYVDYGTTSSVTRKSLRLLKKAFLSFPQQAIRATVTHLKPSGSAWSKAAIQCFLKLVHDRPLQALVTGISEEYVVSVGLVDTTGPDDLHINNILEDEGHAKPAPGPSLQFLSTPEESDTPPPQEEVRAEPQREFVNDPTRYVVHTPKSDWSTHKSDIDGIPREAEAQKENDSHTPQDSGGGGDAQILLDDSYNDETLSDTTVPYIKRVKLTRSFSIHVIRYMNKPHMTNAEISGLLWEKDVLRSMIRQKRLNIPKEIIVVEENLELKESLKSYSIPGTYDGERLKSHITLYDLPRVLQLLEIFEHPSKDLLHGLRREIEFYKLVKNSCDYWTEECISVSSETSSLNDHGHEKDSTSDLDANQIRATIDELRKTRQKIIGNVRRTKTEEVAIYVQQLIDVENEIRELRETLVHQGMDLNQGSTREKNKTDSRRLGGTLQDSSTSTPSSSDSPSGRQTNTVAPMRSHISKRTTSAITNVAGQVDHVTSLFNSMMPVVPGYTSAQTFPVGGKNSTLEVASHSYQTMPATTVFPQQTPTMHGHSAHNSVYYPTGAPMMMPGFGGMPMYYPQVPSQYGTTGGQQMMFHPQVPPMPQTGTAPPGFAKK